MHRLAMVLAVTTVFISAGRLRAAAAAAAAAADDPIPSVIFVASRGGSTEPVLGLVKDALVKVVDKMTADQKFALIWSGDGDPQLFGDGLVAPTDDVKKQLKLHLDKRTVRGSTLLGHGLEAAANRKPSIVVLVTARDIEDDEPERWAVKFNRRFPVHVISFAAWDDKDFKNCADLAARTGGRHTILENKPAAVDAFVAAVPLRTPRAKPDFTLTSKEFVEQFKKDKAAAEAKYHDKVLAITGPLKGLFVKSGYECVFRLDEVLVGGVQCSMKNKTAWLQAAPGQTVTILARWRKDTRYDLHDCILLEAAGDPPPTITAEALGREYSADAVAFRKTYDLRWVYLTGTITGHDGTATRSPDTLFLRGEKGVSIHASTLSLGDLKSFTTGKSVKFLGLVWHPTTGKNPEVKFCVTVE